MSRNKVDTDRLPHWDLSNVYPGLESDELKQAMGDLEDRLDTLDDYLDKHNIAGSQTASKDTGELAEVVSGYLDLTNNAIRLFATLNAYIYAFTSTDSYNTTAKRLRSEVQMLYVRLRKQGTRFQSWIGGFEPQVDEVIDISDTAAAHSFYLKELVEQSKYLMSDEEESLAAELATSGELAWEKLQSTVCSQVVVDFERNGGTEGIPVTALQNIRRSDPDPEVRRRAYDAELEAWKSVREPLAAAMNGIKGAAGTLAARRGRRDALHAALDNSRIDQSTLDTMLGVMSDSFPMFRSYLKAKAKRLDKEKLAWWDMFAPVGKTDRKFSYAEATEFILEHFSGFSGRLADFAQRAFDNNWIDAEPRDGKTGGAFCTGLPGVEESRVLCNFDGSLDQVMTLAHELGHAFHNECKSKRTMLQRITPMTLAETASIFCETIVTDAILKDTSDEEDELAILEAFLIGATQVVVDISSRFMFEKEVFERRKNSELSADDFCEIMLQAQKNTYGDGLDEDFLHPYMWAWKPHYYLSNMSFYNYPYTFGMLFGFGLYGIYQERGESFIPEYETLLSSTGMGTVAELAGRFDIDIRKSEFWKTSMGIIETRIKRYLEI
jgi:pepF/M3 family oligoendopeptidase